MHLNAKHANQSSLATRAAAGDDDHGDAAVSGADDWSSVDRVKTGEPGPVAAALLHAERNLRVYPPPSRVEVLTEARAVAGVGRVHKLNKDATHNVKLDNRNGYANRVPYSRLRLLDTVATIR